MTLCAGVGRTGWDQEDEWRVALEQGCGRRKGPPRRPGHSPAGLRPDGFCVLSGVGGAWPQGV